MQLPTVLVPFDKENHILYEPDDYDVTEANRGKLLVLRIDEALALSEYFLKRAGYVSHEFDQKVIDFCKRLDKYVEDIKFRDVDKNDNC